MKVGSKDSDENENENAPSQSPLGSVEWTEADSVGSNTSMLDIGLSTVFDHQQELESDPGSTPVYIEVGAPVVKRYNFMVVGVNGSGKSTFCERLLQRYFPHFSVVTEQEDPPIDGEPTTSITERARCERIQGNTRIIFTIVDSPGYGDSIDNNQDRFLPIERYIHEQNQLYEINEEYRRPNNQAKDSRIHCCFYFLMPHRVTALDGGFMQRLQSMVPLVPIIAKADTYTTQEIGAQLCNLERCLDEYKIKIFDFHEKGIHRDWKDDIISTTNHKDSTPQDPSRKHATGSKKQEQQDGTTTLDGTSSSSSSHALICPPGTVRPQIPNVFAVISGNRQYMWGVAREDDPQHSDTPRLHSVLFQNRQLHSLARLQECANDMHESWHKEYQKTLKEESLKKEVEKRNQEKLARDYRMRILYFVFLLLAVWFAASSLPARNVEWEKQARGGRLVRPPSYY